jgi:hypothetical protein
MTVMGEGRHVQGFDSWRLCGLYGCKRFLRARAVWSTDRSPAPGDGSLGFDVRYQFGHAAYASACSPRGAGEAVPSSKQLPEPAG